MLKEKKRKITGGMLTVVGYLLSPLSWWNDLFVNIPLAYLFGLLFSLISKRLFLPLMVTGYWITNAAGLIIMHRGVRQIVSRKEQHYTRKQLLKDLATSVLYTALVVILARIGYLKSPSEYFKGGTPR